LCSVCSLSLNTHTHTLLIASVCQLAFGSVSYGQLTPGILLMTVIFFFCLLHNQHCALLSYITTFSSSCLGLPLLRAQAETWVAGVCVCARFWEQGRKKAVLVIYCISSLLPEKGTVRCQGMCSRVYLDLKPNLRHRILIDWRTLIGGLCRQARWRHCVLYPTDCVCFLDFDVLSLFISALNRNSLRHCLFPASNSRSK